MQHPAVLRPAPHETGVKLLDSATDEAAKLHLDCVKSAPDVGFVVVDQECSFAIVAEGAFDSAGHTIACGGHGSAAGAPLMAMYHSRVASCK